MPLTRTIWISETATEFVSQDDKRFRADKGYYCAHVSVIAASWIVARRILLRLPPEQWVSETTEDRLLQEEVRLQGLTSVFVIMLDAQQDIVRYWTVLSPKSLASISNVLSREAPRGVFATAGIRTGIDPRGWLELPMDDGSVFRPMSDHDRFTLQLKERQSGLHARLTTFSSVDRSSEGSAFATTVEFDIPIEKLMWRRSPKLLGSRLIPEGERYVCLERIGHVSDPGAPRNLLQCPISQTK